MSMSMSRIPKACIAGGFCLFRRKWETAAAELSGEAATASGHEQSHQLRRLGFQGQIRTSPQARE